MDRDNTEELLDFAQRLADLARTETVPRFRAGVTVEYKDAAGTDPVTDADRGAEAAMRDLIRQSYPGHGVRGEEMADTAGQSEIEWILDPIDGTRSFVAGMPLWGTLIAACRSGAPVAGVIDHPALDERYTGCPSGAHLNGRPIRTRDTTELEAAILTTTDPYLLTAEERAVFEELQQDVRLTRYGGDCYGYALLASGHVDLVVESGLALHDVAALIPVVRFAGGTITGWCGGNAMAGGRIVAAATQELHAKAVAKLSQLS